MNFSSCDIKLTKPQCKLRNKLDKIWQFLCADIANLCKHHHFVCNKLDGNAEFLPLKDKICKSLMQTCIKNNSLY